MSAHNVNVCDITDDVKEVLKKFRFQKHTSNSALILKAVPAALHAASHAALPAAGHAAGNAAFNATCNASGNAAGHAAGLAASYVNREKQTLEVDEELENVELEELQDILPSHQPRFIVYSYKLDHDDGRVSFPMCFIFYTPRDAHMELQVMYAGTQRALAATVGAPRLLEVREIDELTGDWLKEKLKK